MQHSHVLMFHGVDDGTDLSVTAEDFEKIISFHLQRGYEFDSLDNLVSEKKASKKCYVTFDDGYKSVLRVLPILETYHIPFCIYVISSMIGAEGYLDEIDIQTMLNTGLCIIGNHTCNHVKTRYLKRKELHNEVIGADRVLERITGDAIKHFAFPYGGIATVSLANVLQLLRMKKYETIAITFQDDLSSNNVFPRIIARFDASRKDLFEVL